MAKCAWCGHTIVFGGIERDGGLAYPAGVAPERQRSESCRLENGRD